MRAIGRDEVHDRGGVLQVEGEIGPARIGVELAVAIGDRPELRARLVQRGHAGVAAAGDIDRGQVERNADELVAQDMRHELVDLVADLAGHAAHDRAGRLVVVEHDLLTVRVGDRGSVRFALQTAEGERVQECIEQGEIARRAVGIGPGDVLAQHRVAEAIDDMRELGEDGRIDVGRRVEDEGIDIRLDLAGELLEDEVLILHLGGEAGRLEQALAIPLQGVDRSLCRRQRGRIDAQPLVQEGKIVGRNDLLLDLIDGVVVLRVEHMVHSRQADILVTAPVAGNVVGVEQFVVVRGLPATVVETTRISDSGITILLQYPPDRDRNGGMGDVVDEGMAGAHRACRADERQGVALDEDIVPAAEGAVPAQPLHDLRETMRAPHELAVLVHDEERDVADIGVGQLEAEQLRLILDVLPGRETVIAGKQLAGRERNPCQEIVFAHEQLLRRRRAVGLVLIDEGGRQIVGAGRGARQHHEVGVRRSRVIERIVLAQRDVDRTALFRDQIEPMVEELAEQREPGIEGRRESFVRRDVRQDDGAAFHLDAVGRKQRLDGVGLTGPLDHLDPRGTGIRGEIAHLGGLERGVDGFGRRLVGRGRSSGIDQRSVDRGRIVEGLVDDQVRDQARISVDDGTGGSIIGIG